MSWPAGFPGRSRLRSVQELLDAKVAQRSTAEMLAEGADRRYSSFRVLGRITWK
jgi:hypothetical protein